MPNGEPKQLIRQAVNTKSATGATDELLFDQVPPGQENFYDFVSVMDDDNSISSWFPFVRTPSADYPLKQITDTSQDIRHGLQIQTWLGVGERLGVKILGATSGDDLYAWAVGHYRTVLQ